jgi:thiosulfate/3-mercaptopyruvate sulfurtransferase
MINQCVACHGSRIGEEYRGEHRDQIPNYKYDVHYRKNSVLGGKQCINCHWSREMHFATGEHRYAVNSSPTCDKTCHSSDIDANSYHTQHWDDLSCHVCHSQDYKQCDACHVPHGLDEPSYLSFKIGRNPLPGRRPYKYVTLRHIPIARDTYAGWDYGGGAPKYDDLPTWKYATPHNIQRWTARTDTTGGQSCSNACHNSPATPEGFFLRAVDLQAHPDEAEANAPFIVPDTHPEEWEN